MTGSDPDWTTFLLHEVEVPDPGPDRVLRTARYELGALLGRGGLGVVRQARDQLLHREVALKVMRPDKEERAMSFWREARVTARLDHPGIVPVYDAGTIEGSPFFTMKKVEGHTLRQALKKGRLASVGERIELFLRACDAIAYAHDKGWIHRDLKPSNIMVGRFGEVLIVDWGLAWELGSDEPPVRAGTLAFAAPEQVGGKPHDERADVYALGGVLWYLLAERSPWHGEANSSLLERVSQGATFVPPRGVLPRELDAVVRKALAARPRDRYPSVAELREDLRRYRDGEEVQAASYSPLRRLLRRADRHRLALGVVAVVLTVVAGVLAAAGATSGAVLLQTARMQQEAAQTARAAEAETRRQLLAALVATGSAQIAGGQLASARQSLLRADLVGSTPASALAWADLRARGHWPVHRHELGGTPVSLHVGSSYVLALLDDGRWSTWSLADGKKRSEGTVAGRPVALVDDRRIVSDDDGDLVLTDVFDGEQARTRRQHPDVRIDRAFVGGGEVWVQSFEVTAPPVAAFSLPDLAPVALPEGVTELYVHGLSPDGERFVGSRHRVPSKVVTGEVRTRDGRTVLALENEVRVVLGPQHIVVAEADGVRSYDTEGRPQWRSAGWSGLTGTLSRQAVYVADEGGTIAAWDRDAGAHRAPLLGLDQRPVAVAHDLAGRWVCAVGADGRMLVWAVPETPTHVLTTAPSSEAVAHPGGRLVAYRIEGPAVVVQDVPSGRVLWRRPLDGPGSGLAWSPEGRRLAVGGDPAVVFDLVGGGRESLGPTFGAIGWSTAQLAAARGKGHEGRIMRWHADTLQPLEPARLEAPSLWAAVTLDDGGIVFSTNHRFDESIGVVLSPDGRLHVLDGGGSPDHVGFGLARWRDGLLFARQDGRIVVQPAVTDEVTPEEWKWQADPVTAVVVDEASDTVLALTYGGRLDQVDGRGIRQYSSQLGDDASRWAVRVDDAVVVGGMWGARWLALAAGPPKTLEERLVDGHGWSAVDPATLSLDREQQLTWALGRGQGLASALDGRDDTLAELLRALAR